MSWWDRVKAAFGREVDEAKDVYREAHDRLEADIGRREAELAETPEQKLQRMTEELSAQPDPFDDVRARLDRMRAEHSASDASGSADPADPADPVGGAG